MADRDRFGGSERDYTNRGNQYDVSSWRDTRAGGNIERANRGIPYPTGGRDVRFEGSLPHQFQYRDQGRTVVSDTEPAFTDMGRNRNVPFPQSTGTPNFRPPYGAPGQPSFETWQQQIDPYSNQMRSRTPSDIGYDRMGGGLGGLEEQAAIPNWYKWYDKLINRFGEQKGSELWHQYASDDTGIGSTNEYQTAGLWQTWKKILERTGSEDLANQWLQGQQAV